jgi:DNA transformation protein
LDQLTALHNVTARAMFGGYGLYLEAKFFGIIHKGHVYFKVTAATVPRYQEAGMKPFRPNAKQTLKSFYEVPIDILEEAEALTQWATEAAER